VRRCTLSLTYTQHFGLLPSSGSQITNHSKSLQIFSRYKLQRSHNTEVKIFYTHTFWCYLAFCSFFFFLQFIWMSRFWQRVRSYVLRLRNLFPTWLFLPEDKTTNLRQNITKRLPSDSAPYPRRTDSSATPLPSP